MISKTIAILIDFHLARLNHSTAGTVYTHVYIYIYLQWEFYKALFGGTCPGHPFDQSILNLLFRPYTGIWFLSQLISLWHLCDIIYFLLWSQPCFIVHFTCVLCCMYVLWYSLYVQSRHFMYLFSNSGGWNKYYYYYIYLTWIKPSLNLHMPQHLHCSGAGPSAGTVMHETLKRYICFHPIATVVSD